MIHPLDAVCLAAGPKKGVLIDGEGKLLTIVELKRLNAIVRDEPRCQGLSTTSGQRCRRTANAGRPCCEWHGKDQLCDLQCQAIAKRHGDRCGNRALVDGKWCSHHEGGS